MPRYAKKTDSNQKEIIEWLEVYGCQVDRLHQGDNLPDLLVCYDEWVLIEVKPTLTDSIQRNQIQWLANAGGYAGVVVNKDEALLLAQNPGMHALTLQQRENLTQWLIRNPKQTKLSVNQFREVIK